MSKLPIIAIVVAALTLGYFAYATDAVAYGGSAPETCANCHSMDAQYENWYYSGHSKWAKCTDCHLPHNNIIVYYAEKGRQGAKDTYAFVTGNIPELIRAEEKTKDIVQENCVRCHSHSVESILVGEPSFARYCWECHRHVAHGERGTPGALYQDSSIYPQK